MKSALTGVALLLLASCATPPKPSFDTIDYGYDEAETIFARSARVNVHYVRTGTPSAAPPVVLLHPWGTNLSIWENVAPELGRHREVLLVDLPGHGKSGKPPGRYPPRRLASGVLAALDHAGIERAIFMGNSLGGATSLQVALQAPERVVALVLVSAPGGDPVPQLVQRTLHSIMRPRAIGSISSPTNVMLWWLGSWTWNSTIEKLHTNWHALQGTIEWELFAGALSSAFIEASKWTPEVERIEIPALVVVGTADLIVWPWSGRQLARRLPKGQLFEMAGCSHMPQLDCHDDLMKQVQAFLTELLRRD